jgi:hypothetical protein
MSNIPKTHRSDQKAFGAESWSRMQTWGLRVLDVDFKRLLSKKGNDDDDDDDSGGPRPNAVATWFWPSLNGRAVAA